MGKIDLKEALRIIKTGEWMNEIKVITANIALNKGGKVLVLKDCRVAREEELSVPGQKPGRTSELVKDPGHNHNFTLNMKMRNNEIRKIHPILIFELNGYQVV